MKNPKKWASLDPWDWAEQMLVDWETSSGEAMPDRDEARKMLHERFRDYWQAAQAQQAEELVRIEVDRNQQREEVRRLGRLNAQPTPSEPSDTERMDWLEQMQADVDIDGCGNFALTWQPVGQTYLETAEGSTLRAAVDAAMK